MQKLLCQISKPGMLQFRIAAPATLVVYGNCCFNLSRGGGGERGGGSSVTVKGMFVVLSPFDNPIIILF